MGSLWGAEVISDREVTPGRDRPGQPLQTGRTERAGRARRGRTFTVYAMVPGPAWHRHLVLLAASVTPLPTEPWGTGAAARVWVTVALRTLAA